MFDIECSQDEEMPDQPDRFKHKPLLVCGELICTRCIDTGIRIFGGRIGPNPCRPPDCRCGGADRFSLSARRWLVPGSEGRQFQFHCFDDPQIDPLKEMLDMLTNHGPKEIPTIALSHNGQLSNYYYFSVKIILIF